MKNKIKVLIVEDSSLIVQRLYPVMAEIEFIESIAHAKNGEEAITLLQLIDPRLVILDIKMPGISGIDVLKHIKDEKRECKIIMLTNHSDEEYRKTCLELGADNFLNKTTDIDKMVEVINSIHSKFLIHS
jgi:DNA-binding NarL/FixJ family response regulator